MTAIQVGPAAPSNYEPGRRGETPYQIIAHWTTGSLDSAIRQFTNPGTQVSAHYIIDRDGLLYQVVGEQDTAFHAGAFTVNLTSVGIEHVGGPTYDGFTDEQYATSADLCSEIAERYGFEVSAVTVLGHRDIVPTQCPGTLDLARIRGGSMAEYVTKEAFEAYQKDVRDTLDAMKAVYDPLVSHHHELVTSVTTTPKQ